MPGFLAVRLNADTARLIPGSERNYREGFMRGYQDRYGRWQESMSQIGIEKTSLRATGDKQVSPVSFRR